MIDSHQHFWKYHPVKDAWITEDMAVIRHDFMPPDLEPLLAENGFTGCIAVQADQSEAETLFLAGLASEYPFIKGVVGWIDLRHPLLTGRLDYFSTIPCIKGWRHIVQAEHAGFMLDPDFLKGIAALSAKNFTYDILIRHEQLPEAMALVERFPAQAFVIDHAAKPDIKGKEIKNWAKHMALIARHSQVYCKLSGLLTEADWQQWNKHELFTYMDVLFEHFGPERILFGSDWPVLLLAGGYTQWVAMVQEYLEPLGTAVQQQVFQDNAVKFYNL